jgi:diguanylate cyclase (GGDEF)-like protein/putative nucleotidyltransferase with HDIG domain
MTALTGWRRDLGPTIEERLGAAMTGCERLPVLDRSVQRVLALTDDEDAPTSELVAALESDPALAANILRYANSAHVARPVRAKTVRQAVTMVGRRATRQLCLEAVTFRFFEAAPGNGRTSLGQLHIHAVSVAAVAAATAELVGVATELPHLAGLLHDCGKLLMPIAFGEDEMDALVTAAPCGNARAEAEWARFGVDHAYAGALFAIHSGLDAELVGSIAWHHGGRRGCLAPTPEIACVQLADTVINMLTGAEPDEELLDVALERLGLGREVLDVLAEHATARSGPSIPTAPARLRDKVAELERLAHTDELTGLANRRHWMTTVKDSIRRGCTGAVLLCDVDHFKAINDTHGHSTGDVVLTEIARILARHGIPGRIGGDEFALWLSEHDADHAAELILAEVATAFSGGEAVRVTLSIGIAPIDGPLADALDLADRALYTAKASGRSCACRADVVAA